MVTALLEVLTIARKTQAAATTVTPAILTDL
jgi:hypothetical protein